MNTKIILKKILPDLVVNKIVTYRLRNQYIPYLDMSNEQLLDRVYEGKIWDATIAPPLFTPAPVHQRTIQVNTEIF